MCRLLSEIWTTAFTRRLRNTSLRSRASIRCRCPLPFTSWVERGRSQGQYRLTRVSNAQSPAPSTTAKTVRAVQFGHVALLGDSPTEKSGYYPGRIRDCGHSSPSRPASPTLSVLPGLWPQRPVSSHREWASHQLERLRIASQSGQQTVCVDRPASKQDAEHLIGRRLVLRLAGTPWPTPDSSTAPVVRGSPFPGKTLPRETVSVCPIR